jgi:hypothetical protein
MRERPAMVLLPSMARPTPSIEDLLERAAQLAATHGIDSDAFIASAWTAYLAARPELREELEDKQLRLELKRLRKRGLVGSA